jgi:dolichol-phosphate mannosyltransferase
MADYLLIIPTYNERENIEKLLPEIMADDLALDILVVDDNSPDGTGDLVRQLQSQYADRLHLLARSGQTRPWYRLCCRISICFGP